MKKWKKLIAILLITILAQNICMTNGFTFTKINVYAQTLPVQEGTSDSTMDECLYDQVIENESAWIASLQLNDGAIPMFSDLSLGNKIVPYYSNYSALGLIGNPQYIKNVKSYMDWYLSHLNWPDKYGFFGTIYDYEVEKDGKEKSLTCYDSVDAYSATFLSLIWRYYEVTGDSEYLLKNKEKIMKIAETIILLKDSDGLTWAKADYRIKLLMDNLEVYKGLRDTIEIFRKVFLDETNARLYENHLQTVSYGIGKKLWKKDQGIYRPYLDEADNCKAFQWKVFYADAVSQLYPIWTGFIKADSPQAVSLYNSFNMNYPKWTNFETGDIYPWVLIGYTAAVMGDKERVGTFLEALRKSYIDALHQYPWYCMESGIVVLIAQKMKSMELSEQGILEPELPENGEKPQKKDSAGNTGLINNSAKISIDGRVSDWNKINPLSIGGESGFSLSALQDQNKLFMMVKCSDFNLTTYLYIDNDNDSLTGYHGAPWRNCGIDYMIQNKDVYRYVGTGHNWAWRKVGAANIIKKNKYLEVSVDLETIGKLSSGEMKVAFFNGSDIRIPVKNKVMAGIN